MLDLFYANSTAYTLPWMQVVGIVAKSKVITLFPGQFSSFCATSPFARNSLKVFCATLAQNGRRREKMFSSSFSCAPSDFQEQFNAIIKKKNPALGSSYEEAIPYRLRFAVT